MCTLAPFAKKEIKCPSAQKITISYAGEMLPQVLNTNYNMYAT